MSLAAHGGADGVAAASASGADESERATSDGSGIMKSASSAGASAGVQFDMVASSRLMRFPVRDVMMAFAIANVPQVYDECDHNVMRLAPLHGCRARSARCADKQRTIGDAVYGCFDPNSKSDERNPRRDPEKWSTGFRKRSRAIARDPEKWAPVFGKDHAQ